MTMATSIPLAEVRAHLSELVSRVSTQHERVVVSVRGAPSAVLIAPADLESLVETIAILSDKKSMTRLGTAETELAAGLDESQADLAAAMHRRGHATSTAGTTRPATN